MKRWQGLMRQAGNAAALGIAVSLALAVAHHGAVAQTYPQRPIRIIVPVSAGGGVDALARIVAQHYNAVWGQPAVVDNRTGAGEASASSSRRAPRRTVTRCS